MIEIPEKGQHQLQLEMCPKIQHECTNKYWCHPSVLVKVWSWSSDDEKYLIIQ